MRFRPTPVALVWLFVALAVLAAAIAWDSAAHVRPSYDAFGWLVWGRQTLRLNLNTDGAPSWKPLSYLFALPYAPFGRAQIWLWTTTATVAAFSGAVFGGRIAWELGRRAGATRPGAAVGAAFAGVAVLGMSGFSHQVMIATSDPMVVALTLGAVDAALSGRPRLALAALVLASLGRPETWPFLGLFALWAWRRRPQMRREVVVALALIPLGWFLIPGFTSHSPFVAGDLALKSPDALRHHQLAGVVDRLLGLYGLPMRIAVIGSLVLAALRRDGLALLLGAGALLWVAVEVAFAYHGWPAEPRYMMEAGAIAVVLVGAAVAQALSVPGRGRRAARGLPSPRSAGAEPAPAQAVDGRSHGHLVARGAGLLAVGALVATLVPIGARRVTTVGHQIDRARLVAERIDRLPTVIADLGGIAGVHRCGHPVTTVGFQSTLAWYLNRNVGTVGYKPGREIRSHRPIVFFRAVGAGWQVRPIHTAPSRRRACLRTARLNLDTGRALPPLPVVPPSLRHRHHSLRHHPRHRSLRHHHRHRLLHHHRRRGVLRRHHRHGSLRHHRHRSLRHLYQAG
jgi:hypothetical protein